MKLSYLSYKTPLHIAVNKKNIDIIKILLDHINIDINIKDNISKINIQYN